MKRFQNIEMIEVSLYRCFSKEGFISLLYYEVCSVHPIAECHFTGKSLESYKKNLKTILKGLISFGKGLDTGAKTLSSLAQVELGITRETTLYWEQALLNSIAANDEKLSQETSLAWRTLIKAGLEFVLQQREIRLVA